MFCSYIGLNGHLVWYVSDKMNLISPIMRETLYFSAGFLALPFISGLEAFALIVLIGVGVGTNILLREEAESIYCWISFWILHKMDGFLHKKSSKNFKAS